MSSPSASVGHVGTAVSKERFLVLPIVILILAQMGTTGDNGALSLAASSLTTQLGATTAEIQLANMVYPLVGGAFMIAGGLLGTIFGWVRTFRGGALVCTAGEVALALAPNMLVFIWVGRVLVGLGASLLIPSVLGLIPLLYQGHNRMVAFGCIGAASGLSAVLPLILGIVMETAGMRPTFLLLAVYFFLGPPSCCWRSTSSSLRPFPCGFRASPPPPRSFILTGLAWRLPPLASSSYSLASQASQTGALSPRSTGARSRFLESLPRCPRL